MAQVAQLSNPTGKTGLALMGFMKQGHMSPFVHFPGPMLKASDASWGVCVCCPLNLLQVWDPEPGSRKMCVSRVEGIPQ